MNIVCADAGDGVWLIAVHVDQALEAVLLSAVKKPIDRSLLVYFQVIRIKVIDKVTTDDLTGGALSSKSIRDEAKPA